MNLEIATAGCMDPAAASIVPAASAAKMPMDGATVIAFAGFQATPGLRQVESRGLAELAPPAVEAAALPTEEFFGQAINESAPLLGGTAEAGSVVLVGIGGAVFCVTADPRGAWSLDTATAAPMSGHFDLGADGPKKMLVTSVDSAGNSRGIAGVFVLDTVPPAPPVLETAVVDRSAPVLHGQAEAGSTVTVGLCGAIYSLVADTADRWCLDLRHVSPVSGTLVFGPDGERQVVLACSDAAGNTSTAEGAFVLLSRAPKATGTQLAEAQSAALMAGVADTTRRLLAGLGGRAMRPARH